MTLSAHQFRHVHERLGINLNTLGCIMLDAEPIQDVHDIIPADAAYTTTHARNKEDRACSWLSVDACLSLLVSDSCGAHGKIGTELKSGGPPLRQQETDPLPTTQPLKAPGGIVDKPSLAGPILPERPRPPRSLCTECGRLSSRATAYDRDGVTETVYLCPRGHAWMTKGF